MSIQPDNEAIRHVGAVYGEGFDPQSGGFEYIIIDGVRYLARQVRDCIIEAERNGRKFAKLGRIS